VHHRTGQIIAALGGWAVIQVVATAYARGAGADYPASRYMDTLAFGTLVNGLALGWLLTIAPRTWTRRLSFFALGLAWLATLGVGLRTVTQLTIAYELPGAKKYYTNAESHMRRYLATNDPKEVGPVDYVVFAVKLPDTESAAEFIRPMIGPDTAVVPFQNGADSVETLTRVLGRKPVMMGTCYISSNISAPGEITQTGTFARFVFGEPDGGQSDRSRRLRDVFQNAKLDANYRAGGIAETDEEPAQAEAIQRGHEGRLAHTIINHGHTLAPGDFLYPGHDIFGG
jgi:hypothetical protein